MQNNGFEIKHRTFVTLIDTPLCAALNVLNLRGNY